MPKYDINDPTDLDIIRAQFDMISHKEWEEYIEIAEEKQIGYKNINILKSASRKAGISEYLSPKVLQWVFNLIEKIEEEDDEDDDYDEEE